MNSKDMHEKALSYQIGHARVKEQLFLCKDVSDKLKAYLIASKFSSTGTSNVYNTPCSTCAYKMNSFVLFDEIIGSNATSVDLMLVGMNPYVDEVKNSIPFSGRAGQHLRSILSSNPISKYNIVIFNTVPCFIEANRDPSAEVIARCSPMIMKDVISILAPKAIVYLGDVALKGLAMCLEAWGVEKNTIQPWIGSLKHNIVQTPNRIYAHTYHPSYLNYSSTEVGNTVRSKMHHIFEQVGIKLNYGKNGAVASNHTTNGYAKNNIDVQASTNVYKVKNADSRNALIELLLMYMKEKKYQLVNGTYIRSSYRSSPDYESERIICRFKRTPYDFFDMDVTDVLPYIYYESDKQKLESMIPLAPIDKCRAVEVPLDTILNRRRQYQETLAASVSAGKMLYEPDLDPLLYTMLKLKELVGFEHSSRDLYRVCYTDIEIDVLSTPMTDKMPDDSDPFCEVTLVTNIIDDEVYTHINAGFFLQRLQESGSDCSSLESFKDTVCTKIESISFSSAIDSIVSSPKSPVKDGSTELTFKLVIHRNEEELLQSVINQWMSVDIVTGWNVYFDNTYILSRFSKVFGKYDLDIKKTSTSDFYTANKKVLSDAKLNTQVATTKSLRYGYWWLPCVSFIDAQEVYKAYHHLDSYSLDNVSKHEFGLGKVNLDLQKDTDIYIQDEAIAKYTCYNILDTLLVKYVVEKYGLVEQYIGLSIISYLSPFYTFKHTLLMMEAFLYYMARMRKCVLRQSTRSKDFQKTGGYVRSVPTKKLFHLVSCFDVASMYPNIIRTFNISFDTFAGIICVGPFVGNEKQHLSIVDSVLKEMDKIRQGGDYTPNTHLVPVILDPMTSAKETELSIHEISKLILNEKLVLTPRGTLFKNEPDGVAVDLMAMLLDARSTYKKRCNELKDPYACLLSLAYKIASNSYYGAHGNVAFRFFSPYLAESITLTGQMINKYQQIVVESIVTRNGEHIDHGSLAEQTMSS